jgi:hypothetical protein
MLRFTRAEAATHPGNCTQTPSNQLTNEGNAKNEDDTRDEFSFLRAERDVTDKVPQHDNVLLGFSAPTRLCGCYPFPSLNNECVEESANKS